MASVSTYLNFPGTAEQAMAFYRSAFRTEYAGPIFRFKDAPPQPGCPAPSPTEANLVMHVSLPILGGHVLMASDVPAAMGAVNAGNHVYINLQPDTRAQTDRLFKELSVGGKVETPLQDMFWGAYFGVVVDRFGIQWMFNCAAK